MSPEEAAALPEGVRRQLVRFLLRWGRESGLAARALDFLPRHDPGPRDRFDRCRALLAAGQVETAQELARELVNAPDAGHWGHRAVGEVFLALDRPHRADERFRAGGDPIGRARAHLLLRQPEAALRLLPEDGRDDPEAEGVRLAALRESDGGSRGEGGTPEEVERGLELLFEEERQALLEALGRGDPVLGAALDGRPPSELDDEALRTALQRVFGYDDFRNGQLEVIRPLLAGQSVLGMMPTGAGKSLCFQLPAALLPGATVVISPLIALMKDQVDGLPPHLYRRATLINSSLEPGEADRRLEAVARGEVSLVYAAPERLRQFPFVQALKRRGVSLFVIDEAHCVSLWGHDFRPDYFFVQQVLRDLGNPTVLALTATATPPMQADISRQLGVRLRHVNLGTFRPNLAFAIRKLPNESEKWRALSELLQAEKGPAIVYVDRRKLTEELSERLKSEGIAAQAYHAGMEREARDRAQTRFMLGEVRVIVATVAFGMGVDKADVRLVVHYNLPRCLEAYYQEAGRAGRDGLPAGCVLLYTPYDKANLTRRTQGDRLQAREILSLHQSLARRLGGRCGVVPADELERTCATDGTRLRVGISLLQGLGAIQRGYDLPGTVWLASRGSGGTLPAAEADRLRALMQAAGLNGRGAATLPAPQAAAACGETLEQLEPLLLRWQEAGGLYYRPGARGMGLRAVERGTELEREVNQALAQVGKMDLERLRLLTDFLETAECRQLYVARYFGGHEAEGCGVCDNCLRAEQRRLHPGAASVVAEGRRAAGRDPLAPATDEESALFEHLRAWRREKAREEGVPAYVIFHDRILYEIARIRPRTLPALAEIPGVGRTKLRAYGDEVLSLIRQEG